MNSVRSSIFLGSILITFLFFSYFGLSDPSNYGTDLTRYYYQFQESGSSFTSTDFSKTIFLTDYDIGFNFIYFIFRSFGLPFYSLLFLLQFLYFNSTAQWVYSEGKIRSCFLVIPVFIYLWFFLPALTVVALRQGISIYLLIFLFLPQARKSNFLCASIILLISISVHLSSLIVLPYFLLLYFCPNKLQAFIKFYPAFLFLYFMNLPLFLSGFSYLPFAFGRALVHTEGGYIVGFTLGKALSITLPYFLYILTSKYVNYTSNLRFYYTFAFYIFTVGILLSGFPYHDRVFLIAWPVTPILVSSSFLYMLNSFPKKHTCVQPISWL